MRERLLQEVVLAIESGLEQPVKVGGTIPGGKDPIQYPDAQAELNRLGVRTFSTAIVGMPPELWEQPPAGEEHDMSIVPYADLPPAEWDKMVKTWVNWFEDLNAPGAAPFSFTVVPGTQAYNILKKREMIEYDEESGLPSGVKGIDDTRAMKDIASELYSFRSIKKRMQNTNFTPRHRAFMWAANYAALRTFRNAME